MILHGDKVNLRDPRTEDLEAVRAWTAPDQAWQTWDAPWEHAGREAGLAARKFEERLSEPPPGRRTRLEIETQAGRHIGWVGSYWIQKETQWRDCGIVIGTEDASGQGYGREAFSLWLDYQLRAFDLPRIGMGTWSGNERMIRLAARVGLREEACFVDARIVGDQRYDAVRWGVTRAQWERYRAPGQAGLRRTRPADWERMIALTQQLYQHHRELLGAPPYTREDAREDLYGWMARRHVHAWLWQESGEVVGLARARHDGVYFLDEFVVDRAHRSHGIGTRFLAAIEDELRTAGESDLFLSMVSPANAGAIDFYRRCGYDLINTFELRKSLTRDRRGRAIDFLGRRFRLGANVPELPPPSE